MTTPDEDQPMTTTERHTLPGTDYFDPATYRREREQIFFRSWYFAGRIEQVEQPGQWFTIDVVGESILVICGDDGQLRAFYNVCRHRGSRLRDEESGFERGSIMCPYHAWCYDFTGKLVATPKVDEDEVDRSQLSLWPVHVDVWQGFVFVNLDRGTPQPLREYIAKNYDDLLGFERFDMGVLRIGAQTEWLVEANWKILVENYNECLHCPSVHPELIAMIPIYRTGWVYDESREDGGVLVAGGSSYTANGTSNIAVIPTMTELEAKSVYGGTIFPNALLDISGTGVILTQLLPMGPTRTKQIALYLFHPDSMAKPDFDPTPYVEFGELVGGQDNAICERAQRGVRSRAFDHGVYPAKDEYVWEFNQRYLRERDGA
jgi:Rieske 2Fe-2S family protein